MTVPGSTDLSADHMTTRVTTGRMPPIRPTRLLALVHLLLLAAAACGQPGADGKGYGTGETDGANTSGGQPTTGTDPGSSDNEGTFAGDETGSAGDAPASTSDTETGDGPSVGCDAGPTPTERLDQVTQYGITWTFDEAHDVGQFVSGDYFVIDDGSGVQIVSVTPSPVSGVNGSMLNPSTNRQAYDTDADAGYDDYDPSLAVAFPVTIAAGDSLISTETITDQATEWNGSTLPAASSSRHINTAAVLTVLDTTPLEGTFRPPYVGTEKPLYNVCQLDRSVLPGLSAEGMTEPSSGEMTGVAMLERGLERPWILHGQDWIGRQIHPVQNMNNYHENVSVFWGMASAYLMTDAVTDTLLYRYVQTGIDAYHTITLPDTGTDSSHFATPIVLTGMLLGNEDIQNTFILDSENIDPRGHEKFYYHGDRQLSTASSIVPDGQSWTGWTNSAGQAVFFAKQSGEEYEHLHPSEWVCHSPHCKAEVYRSQHDVHGLVGQILALRLLAAQGHDTESLYDHSATLDYMDRWMEEGFETEEYGDTGRSFFDEWQFHHPTTVYYRRYQSGGSDFVNEMWDAYR